MVSIEPKVRLNIIIDTAWEILFQRIAYKRFKVNKESSLQLHLSKIIHDLGDVFCILPDERFDIELETAYNNKNIDIICSLGDVQAAIELKCFKKSSNRARDIDLYDVLNDIQRLDNFDGFAIKKFICLADSSYYSSTEPKGMANSVKITEGTHYKSNIEIIPGWVGKWKIKRDEPIILKNDLICKWVNQDDWYYLKVDR